MLHVVSSKEYLNIMWSKEMAKAIVDDTRECKWKEKEEKWFERAIKTLIIVERTIQRSIEKWTRATFIQDWSPIAIRDVGDQFHNNFATRLQASPYQYRGVNLGATTQTQKVAKAKARTRLQVVECVPSRHNIVSFY
jgi:hypothetical protein